VGDIGVADSRRFSRQIELSDPVDTLKTVAQMVDEALDGTPADHVAGICISAPWWTESDGTAIESRLPTLWNHINPQGTFWEYLGWEAPVSFHWQPFTALLGELADGKAVGQDHVVYVDWSEEITATALDRQPDGEIWIGRDRRQGTIGHVPLLNSSNRERCSCGGTGCLVATAGESALIEHNLFSEQGINAAAEDVAQVIGRSAMLMNPALLILGGSVVSQIRPDWKKFLQALYQFTPPILMERVQVEIGSGSDALEGSLQAALEEDKVTSSLARLMTTA
jgi:predicted NBD/HSP70 family sugar kinase